MNPPTAADPLMIPCTECEGQGCGACVNGFMEVAQCPWKVAAGAWPAIEAADRAKQGVWPVAGGWLDQTRACLEAVDFVKRVDNQCDLAERAE